MASGRLNVVVLPKRSTVLQIFWRLSSNPLSTNHTLTGHVNVNNGVVAFGNAPDGTTIDFSLTNAGGASATFVPDVGVGTYLFQARLRNSGNGAASGYSPAASIVVS